MSSCTLNWLQTIILTVQHCWGPGPQSSWPKKIIVCNTLGELGPFFALVRGRFFSKAFWPGGSEFHGDLFLAPPVPPIDMADAISVDSMCALGTVPVHVRVWVRRHKFSERLPCELS